VRHWRLSWPESLSEAIRVAGLVPRLGLAGGCVAATRGLAGSKHRGGVLDGSERCVGTDGTVADFLRWSFSDLRDNTAEACSPPGQTGPLRQAIRGRSQAIRGRSKG
jgi:hypothetical protein